VRSTGLVLLTTVGLATPAVAQGSRCLFQIDNVDRQGAVVETAKGTNYFAGGNVRLSCRGTQITMRSDSVASYGGSVVQFIGNVKYRDSTVTMDADRGTYYRAGEKWEARGNVTTSNAKSGSTLVGPSLDYLREVPGVRDTAEMYAVSRPKIRYATVDSTGAQGEPYLIVADRVRLKGNDQIWAGGKVTVDRSDFTARSDSMRLDTGKGGDGTLIGGNPTLRGVGADSFIVSGNRIDLKLDGKELTYLLAKGKGHTVSKEWDLVADTIAMDLNARKLEQTLAWGDSIRPSATSPAYALKADSLALDTPGQRLKEVRGFGKGWLGGATYPPTKDRDWMKGDTIVARFTQADSGGRSRAALSQIEARRAAQSYHLEPNVKFPTRPSVNYARGDVIVVTLKQDSTRAVDRVDIRGKVDGVQLEATSDTTSKPKADSTRAVGAAQ
jgi:lipopolysaccharide export system protein LptA